MDQLELCTFAVNPASNIKPPHPPTLKHSSIVGMLNISRGRGG